MGVRLTYSSSENDGGLLHLSSTLAYIIDIGCLPLRYFGIASTLNVFIDRLSVSPTSWES